MSDNKTIAQRSFQTATAAMQQENWDYAISMFHQACKLFPDNVLYRQGLRGCEEKKYGNNGTGKRMAGMKIAKIKANIKKCKMQKDWHQIDILAEDGLQLNPWDAALNAELGIACRERGFNEVARFCFQKATEYDNNNIEYWRELADALKELRQYPDAIKCWEQVQKLDPNSGEARQQITYLTTQGTIESGYDTAEDTRQVKAPQQPMSAYDKDFEARGAGQSKVDGPGQSDEADLQRRLRKDPQDQGAYLQLARLYEEEKKFPQAIETYQQSLETCGEDPNIRELMEDTEIDLLTQKAEKASEAATAAPDDESKQEASTKAKTALLKRRLAVLATRVERYPQDLRRKCEYGQLLMKTGQPDKAIPLLQQAGNDSRMKGSVMLDLGKCFYKIKNVALSLRHFQMAVKSLDPQDEREKLCEALYNVGRLLEHQQKNEEAIEQYNEVLMLDYGYKDTNERLMNLQSGGA